MRVLPFPKCSCRDCQSRPFVRARAASCRFRSAGPGGRFGQRTDQPGTELVGGDSGPYRSSRRRSARSFSSVSSRTCETITPYSTMNDPRLNATASAANPRCQVHVRRAPGVGGRAQPGGNRDGRHAPHDEAKRPAFVLLGLLIDPVRQLIGGSRLPWPTYRWQ